MDALLRDVRYAARVIRRQPAFALVTVLTLGLAIGGNTAVFSLVNAVLLRQLPFDHPERLVWIWSTRTDRAKAPFSIADFLDVRTQTRTVEAMAAFSDWAANLTGTGEPERLQGLRATGNLFQVLGVRAGVGRMLTIEDGAPGAPRVVVLSDGIWRRRFGADNALVGRTLILNGEAHTVVGILAPNFVFPVRDVDIAGAFPYETDPRRADRSGNFLRAVGRLGPGVTISSARQELTAIAQRLRDQYPETNARKVGVTPVPLHEEIVGDFRLMLWVLLGAVGLVLLLACANLANLGLSRASARHRELAVRAALGASRLRLLGQLLTESLVLAMAGGVLGVALAQAGVTTLLALGPTGLPRLDQAALDVRVLTFTFIVSLAAGVAVGVIPAWHAGRLSLAEDLNGSARGSSDAGPGARIREALIGIEVAVSLALLICAGLFVQSFARLQDVNPGFSADHVLVARLSLPRTHYPNRAALQTFADELTRRLQSLPGVRSSAAVSILPMSGAQARLDLTIVGRPAPRPQDVPSAQIRLVSPQYFETMKIPIRGGRPFSERDTAQGTGSVIINETLARQFWKEDNPIGSHLLLDDGDVPRDAEIVGIVGDVKQFSLDDEPSLDLYVPIAQVTEPSVQYLTNSITWVIRTSADPQAIEGAARREIHAVDGDVALSSVKTLDQVVSGSVAPRRFNLQLVELFAEAAFLLAAAGVYALTAHSVVQRTREIGIRIALGADRWAVIRLIVRAALSPVVFGLACGIVMALVLTRVIAGLLYGISPADPLTFSLIALMLAVAAAVASLIPAIRATAIDPLVALRAE